MCCRALRAVGRQERREITAVQHAYDFGFNNEKKRNQKLKEIEE